MEYLLTLLWIICEFISENFYELFIFLNYK